MLRSGRDIEKIMVQKGNVEGTIKRIVAQAAEKGVVIQEVSRQKLDELSQTKNHQGVIALVSAHDYVEVEDILANCPISIVSEIKLVLPLSSCPFIKNTGIWYCSSCAIYLYYILSVDYYLYIKKLL